MASVSIGNHWPDGEATVVTIEADAASPDLLSDMTRRALDAWREAVTYVLTLEADEAEGSDYE